MEDGLFVSEVAPDSPADEAGLQSGDYIIALLGRLIASRVGAESIIVAQKNYPPNILQNPAAGLCGNCLL